MSRQCTQELVSKISKSTYQLQQKGNEIQFNFNATVTNSISLAKKELQCFKPTEKEAQETLKKVQQSLDEGMEAIEKHQKHIIKGGGQFRLQLVHCPTVRCSPSSSGF